MSRSELKFCWSMPLFWDTLLCSRLKDFGLDSRWFPDGFRISVPAYKMELNYYTNSFSIRAQPILLVK